MMLVVSSTTSENSEWIASHFPDMAIALYIVDGEDPHSVFRTPMSK